MVAQPKHQTPPPERQTPRMGQRARPTTPFVTGHDPLTEATELLMRDPCWRCHGAGHLRGERTVCVVCGAGWWRDEVEQGGHRGIRHTLLPCKHGTAGREPHYEAPICPTCTGHGYLPRWVRLGDLLPWMRDWFEQWYAEVSAEITAQSAAQQKSF